MLVFVLVFYSLKTFNMNDLLNIHKNIMIKNEKIVEKIRKDLMFVPNKGTTRAFIQKPPPQEIPNQLQDFFEWFAKEIRSETNPILIAAMTKSFIILILCLLFIFKPTHELENSLPERTSRKYFFKFINFIPKPILKSHVNWCDMIHYLY